MVSEFLRYYYPYGHIMLSIYGAFSLFICFLGVRYLYFRLKEEAALREILSKIEENRRSASFKKSSLIDDLPYLLPETPSLQEVKEDKSVLV